MPAGGNAAVSCPFPANSQITPPTHKGKSAGFRIVAWSAMNATGPRTMSRLLMRTLYINSRKGK